jgi:hypothetical protein
MTAETMITAETPPADIVDCLERLDADWAGGEIGVIVVGDLRVWQAEGEWQWRTADGSESGPLDSLEELEILVAVHGGSPVENILTQALDEQLPTPPTELWQAVLLQYGLQLESVLPGEPTDVQLGEALEATRRFVREWDAEAELEKLGAERDTDLRLTTNVIGEYEVQQSVYAGGYDIIGSGSTPAEAVADAELVLPCDRESRQADLLHERDEK